MAISAAVRDAESVARSFESRTVWRPSGLSPAGLEPALTEANLGFLERVASRAAASPRQDTLPPSLLGLPAEYASRVLRLLPAERSRLAAAPFALFDLRFGDAAFWANVLGKSPPTSIGPNGPAAGRWARGATVLAWHLAQRGGLVAALTIGMTPAVQALWSGMPLAALESVASAAEEVLGARWGSHPRFWNRMLTAVERDDSPGLHAVRHLGWQLLAADGLRPTLARRRLPRE